jgi:hypothetical protein
MVVSSHQRDFYARVPIFLLADMASTHDTMGLTPAVLLFRRELLLPCDLLSPAGKEQPTVDHAADLVDHLHDFHNYARQHLKPASDWMKAQFDKQTNFSCYHGVAEHVSVIRPAQREDRSSSNLHGRAHTR